MTPNHPGIVGRRLQTSQPTNQPLRLAFTPSSSESTTSHHPPPSHLIRREGRFRPAHVRAGQAFEAQIPGGARVNLHSLKARIFFAEKNDIPYFPRLTGCPGSNILTLKSATFKEWLVEWGPPFKIMSSYPRIRKGMQRNATHSYYAFTAETRVNQPIQEH